VQIRADAAETSTGSGCNTERKAALTFPKELA
jgi:hypothetical protein